MKHETGGRAANRRYYGMLGFEAFLDLQETVKTCGTRGLGRASVDLAFLD